LVESRKTVVATLGADAVRLVAHVEQRREEERAELARILHHDVSGMLAAARMDLSRLTSKLAADADTTEQLRRVDQLLEQVIRDARAAMQGLHPALIDHFGLGVALRHLIEEYCRHAGVRYAVDFPAEPEVLETPVPIAVFRTVETLLAAAGQGLREINVTLSQRRDAYLLELRLTRDPALATIGREDDLAALRAWLESLGANWKRSTHGAETVLELRLPRREEQLASEVPGGG
jgi:signal transduction histidine kinase